LVSDDRSSYGNIIVSVLLICSILLLLEKLFLLSLITIILEKLVILSKC